MGTALTSAPQPTSEHTAKLRIIEDGYARLQTLVASVNGNSVWLGCGQPGFYRARNPPAKGASKLRSIAAIAGVSPDRPIILSVLIISLILPCAELVVELFRVIGPDKVLIGRLPIRTILALVTINELRSPVYVVFIRDRCVGLDRRSQDYCGLDEKSGRGHHEAGLGAVKFADNGTDGGADQSGSAPRNVPDFHCLPGGGH